MVLRRLTAECGVSSIFSWVANGTCRLDTIACSHAALRKEHSRPRTKHAGFTLIELLAVIGIIAILAALLLPALNRAKAQAQSAKCKSILHQLSLALNMYLTDNNSKYPPAWYVRNGRKPSDFWEALLQPYYAPTLGWTNAALQCPGYTNVVGLEEALKLNFAFPGGSYAYNAWGTDTASGYFSTANEMLLGLGPYENEGFAPIGPISSDMVKAPADMFAIGESRLVNTTTTGASSREYEGYDEMLPGTPSVGESRLNPLRHGKNYNQLFCDGHIEAIPPMILFNVTNNAVRWNNDHQPHSETW